MRLMTGSKIKDLAATAVIAAPAAKHLSPLVPTDEHKSVRLRYIKPFPIHFRLRNLKIVVESLGDGVPRLNHPNTFLLPGFAPPETTSRSHEFSEYLRIMSRVKHNQAHSF